MQYENEYKKSLKKNVGLKKNHIVKVRVTGDEKEQILKKADELNMSMSDLVRETILTNDANYIEHKKRQIESRSLIKVITEMTNATIELERQHKKIGNNINQITRLLNERKNKLNTKVDLDKLLPFLANKLHKIQRTDDALLERSDKAWRQLK